MTVTTVGAFTFDPSDSTIAGPAEFMRSDDYRRTIAGIESGSSMTFRAAMQHSPNFETALLVTIQTAYAGWAGMQQFNRARGIA